MASTSGLKKSSPTCRAIKSGGELESLHGKVVLEIVIGRDGQVDRTRARRDYLRDPQTVACLKHEVQTSLFTRILQHDVQVRDGTTGGLGRDGDKDADGGTVLKKDRRARVARDAACVEVAVKAPFLTSKLQVVNRHG